MTLYKRGKVWWTQFEIDGRRHYFSTRKKDRAEAEAVERLLMAPLLLKSDASMLLDTARREAAKLSDDADRMTASRMTFSNAFRKYPKERRDGLPKAASTMCNAEMAWRNFSNAMAEAGKRCLGDVSPDEAKAYLETLAPRWRQVVYHVLKNVYEGNGMPHPFGRKPARAAGAIQHREALSREQIAALLSAAEEKTKGTHGTRLNAEYPTYIRFLLYTGLRLGDAATAKVSQVDFANGILERIMDKTGRRITIPLHPAVLALLPRDGEYLFPYLQRIYSSGQGAISKQLSRIFRKAGIEGPNQAFCGHSLRTTFAEICAENNVPLPVIQSWLGHTSQEVTRIYARVESLRAKREAMAKLPEF